MDFQEHVIVTVRKISLAGAAFSSAGKGGFDYLYKDGVHKRILKDIVKKWISPEVLTAPKRGFSIPLYDWMRGPWKPLVYEYLSPSKIREIGILNEDVVKQELNNFYRYRGGRAEKIMLMLNFQMWAERWL